MERERTLERERQREIQDHPFTSMMEEKSYQSWRTEIGEQELDRDVVNQELNTCSSCTPIMPEPGHSRSHAEHVLRRVDAGVWTQTCTALVAACRGCACVRACMLAHVRCYAKNIN